MRRDVVITPKITARILFFIREVTLIQIQLKANLSYLVSFLICIRQVTYLKKLTCRIEADLH